MTGVMERGVRRAAEGPTRLSLLDGLRTIAAFGVMFFHMSGLFGSENPFSRAYLFVDLFFMLSGFVLALSAEPKLAAELTTAGFMRGRVRRLWPVLAIGAIAGALPYVSKVEPVELLALVVCSLLLLPVFQPGSAIFPLNGPQWSLFWELAANLVHGCVLRRLSDSALALAVAIAGGMLAAAIWYSGCNCEGSHADGWWLAAPRIGWSYLLGVAMARCWSAGVRGPRLDWRLALLLPLACVLALPWLPLGIAVGDAAMSMAVLPALFWLAACARPAGTAAAAVLERFGDWSFPIYAFHVPIIAAFLAVQDSWASRATAVVVVILVAATLPRSIARPRSKRRAQARLAEASIRGAGLPAENG